LWGKVAKTAILSKLWIFRGSCTHSVGQSAPNLACKTIPVV